MSNKQTSEKIDITKDICPMTFVKTKLKLEKMEPGQILEVALCEGEPLLNLPRSVEKEGHKVLGIEEEGSYFKVIIERC
ncbi:MAG: sulfurtransferase TusA family protein [Candidatus Dadabacteria bacterium]|nr:sulfurtransferase TusA family protein [Candidatus Dadabacteria bacterium]NIQ14225.1 sulfurtransferase TusA family protein [Candidatus Dadabacteria bacterium]